MMVPTLLPLVPSTPLLPGCTLVRHVLHGLGRVMTTTVERDHMTNSVPVMFGTRLLAVRAQDLTVVTLAGDNTKVQHIGKCTFVATGRGLGCACLDLPWSHCIVTLQIHNAVFLHQLHRLSGPQSGHRSGEELYVAL